MELLSPPPYEITRNENTGLMPAHPYSLLALANIFTEMWSLYCVLYLYLLRGFSCFSPPFYREVWKPTLTHGRVAPWLKDPYSSKTSYLQFKTVLIYLRWFKIYHLSSPYRESLYIENTDCKFTENIRIFRVQRAIHTFGNKSWLSIKKSNHKFYMQFEVRYKVTNI